MDMTKLSKVVCYDPHTGLMFKSTTVGLVQVGNKNHDGYLRFHLLGRERSVHRIAWRLAVGPIPAGLQIDHINRVKTDNRLENLRPASRSQNQTNIISPNRTGFRGVWRRAGGYGASIQKNGTANYLGYFSSAEEAARAYDAGAKLLHGEFAILNFPEADRAMS